MKADQHPALSAEPAELPTLTLVLPSGLTSDQALTSLTHAIAQVRGALAARTRQFQQLADGYATRSDHLSQALCRGQALGSEHAAAAIDEAIIEIFDLWAQYQAQLQHQAADPGQHPTIHLARHDRAPVQPPGPHRKARIAAAGFRLPRQGRPTFAHGMTCPFTAATDRFIQSVRT